MGETANALFRELDRVEAELRSAQNRLVTLRARLAALGIEDAAAAPQLARTGYRMLRGTHGVSYVSDPEGVDRLPLGVQAPPKQ